MKNYRLGEFLEGEGKRGFLEGGGGRWVLKKENLEVQGQKIDRYLGDIYR